MVCYSRAMTVAARYQIRELAHVEALRMALPPVPAADCAYSVYQQWAAQRDAVAAMMTAEQSKAAALLCCRCNGTGTTQFKHRHHGVCYQCNGDGWSRKGRKAMRSA